MFQNPAPDALAARLTELRAAHAGWLDLGFNGRIRAM